MQSHQSGVKQQRPESLLNAERKGFLSALKYSRKFLLLKGILFIMRSSARKEKRKRNQNRSAAFSKQTVLCIRSLGFAIKHHVRFIMCECTFRGSMLSRTQLWIITGLGNTGVGFLYFPEGYDNYNATNTVQRRRRRPTQMQSSSFELEEFLGSEMEWKKSKKTTTLRSMFLRLFFMLPM